MSIKITSNILTQLHTGYELFYIREKNTLRRAFYLTLAVHFGELINHNDVQMVALNLDEIPSFRQFVYHCHKTPHNVRLEPGVDKKS